MEKKLRRKFVSITMSVVFIMLFIIVALLNLVNYSNIDDKANNVISIIEANDGIVVGDFHQELAVYGESAYGIRYFSVLFSGDDVIVDISNFSSVTAGEAISISSSLEKESGIYRDYKYQIIEVESGTMVVFVDCSSEILTFKTTLFASIFISIFALIGVFILSVIFSRKAVMPFVANNERQKKFITDVSHELKTPLAIIKANTEVLEMQYGTSDWTLDTHKQVEGLNNLVAYLIRLSKMEEEGEIVCENINLSEMLENSCNNIAILSDFEIEKNIKSDVHIYGDRQLFGILISILLENAVKYTSGKIEVSLDKTALKITNACEDLEVENVSKFFDRFYKADNARNTGGSFGIGLSMAKRIAEKHNKTISASSDKQKNITFKVSL